MSANIPVSYHTPFHLLPDLSHGTPDHHQRPLAQFNQRKQQNGGDGIMSRSQERISSAATFRLYFLYKQLQKFHPRKTLLYFMALLILLIQDIHSSFKDKKLLGCNRIVNQKNPLPSSHPRGGGGGVKSNVQNTYYIYCIYGLYTNIYFISPRNRSVAEEVNEMSRINEENSFSHSQNSHVYQQLYQANRSNQVSSRLL